MGNEINFLLADKLESFLQVFSITLGVCNDASPKTQNNKFFVSLQYLKKEVSDEVEFLHADKHNSLVQIDDMVFDRDGKALHII